MGHKKRRKRQRLEGDEYQDATTSVREGGSASVRDNSHDPARAVIAVSPYISYLAAACGTAVKLFDTRFPLFSYCK